MGHEHVIRLRPAGWVALAVMLLAGLALPTMARAEVTLIEPADGTHVDHLERAPLVVFDPGTDLQPKWVLLAIDPEMKTTVRYCRQFMWAATQHQTMAWGCNRWATGVDQRGVDKLEPLVPGRAYYWQVVSKKSPTDATEVQSQIRSFYVDPEPKQDSIVDISNKVMGTAFDDGTQLNLGAAAFVNSKVKIGMPKAKRLSVYGFRLSVPASGTMDASRSYVKITSAAGTRYVRVKRVAGGLQGVWTLNAKERRLKNKRFTYQVHARSTSNGSLVRSRVAIVVIKGRSSTSTRVPAWRAD